MKIALVCGAGGFIGHHLVSRFKEEGYWVRGVDVKLPEFAKSDADEFLVLDLRTSENCKTALTCSSGFDEVYQLAADMGGMGYIERMECEIMTNSALINLNMIQQAQKAEVSRYFFSSSACVYPNMQDGDPAIDESGAYPAEPHNEYGWEKLYSERLLMAYSRKSDMETRIARFQNCYGPLGTWQGGREKAPTAICRKVALVPNNGDVEIWGDGSASRSFIYVSDLVEGILTLMRSTETNPVNIGVERCLTIRELTNLIAEIAGKKINIVETPGPVGVLARNHLFEKIHNLGWESRTSLEDGLNKLYRWICTQVSDYS
jgi:nucleoside-diphosphate-sugar epimerase